MKGYKMKKLYLLSLVFICLLSIPSCTTKKASKNDRTTIAVIPKGTTHIFWKSIHAGAIKAAKELDIDIIWKGPLKEDDRESQITVVENFITAGVSGMVLAPLDDKALVRPVIEATRNDIPVVIIDSDLKSDAYASFVATDNYAGGQKAAEHLAKIINGKGDILLLRYQEGSASTANREKGFLDAIKKYPDITVVSDNQYGGATTESAYQASENLISSFTDANGVLNVQGIFCPNESTTFGMLRALQDSGFAGKVKFVGFDSSQAFIKAMQNDQLHGLVLQDPMNMGYLGVKTIVEHLKGVPVEKKIDTGSKVATPENINDPEISKLFKPDIEKWLKSN